MLDKKGSNYEKLRTFVGELWGSSERVGDRWEFVLNEENEILIAVDHDNCKVCTLDGNFIYSGNQNTDNT